MGKMAKKLYLIGIDAAPLWLIKKLDKKTGLKGFSRFFQNGTLIDLESTLPPVTAAAWPTIYTGKNPGEHGVIEFFSIDRDYNKQLAFYDPKQNLPFWDILSKKGLKSLVITPAMVIDEHAASNVDMITGFPLKPKYNNSQLKTAAHNHDFDGEANIETKISSGALSINDAANEYCDSIKRRSALALDLIKQKEYDLVFICFTETDRLQHFCLGNQDGESIVEPLYKEISIFIEQLYKHGQQNKEEFAIMLVSDHGAQPVKAKFMLNSWLIQNKFAILKKVSAPTKKLSITDSARLKIREMALGGFMEEAYAMLPNFAKVRVSQLMNLGLYTNEENMLKVHDLNFENFEMSKTKAFGSISSNPVGMIWLNDSRFSNPSLKTSEKKEVLQELKEGLFKIKTPSGNQLVSAIIEGEKYYGKHGKVITPDLLVKLAEGYGVDVSYYSQNKLFKKPERLLTGDHSYLGIFGYLDSSNSKSVYKNLNLHIEDISNLIIGYFK